MRPLIALVLVLAAGAALSYAVLSGDSGSEREQSGVLTPDVLTIEPEVKRPPSALAKPDIREALDPVLEVTREAVATESGEEPMGSFGNEFRGTVTDPNGLPLEAATVVLTQDPVGSNGLLRMMMQKNAGPKKPRYERTTDADGQFTIKGAQPGTGYTLIARHENFSTVEIPYIDVPEEGVVEESIQLELGFLVHGYVRDQNSLPVPDAEITLESVPFYAGAVDHPDLERRVAVTNERGAYRLENVTPGNRTLSVTAANFGSQTKTNLQVHGEDRSVEQDFRLQPGAMIAGRIFGPEKTGIVNASIEAIMYTKEMTSRGRTVSLEDGEFVIEGIMPGELYQLIARADGWGELRLNRITAGDTNVMIEMAQQGGVQGRVVDARTGKPLTNFRCSVRFVNTANNMYARSAVEKTFEGATGGAFNIEGLEQNTYAIQCYATGYAPTFSDNFAVTQGLLTPDVEIRMSKGGGLVGTVRNASGGPIKGAQIKTNENNWVESPFTTLLGGMMPRTTTPKIARSDESGKFNFEMLTPGTYQIEVSHAEYTSSVLNDIQISPGPPYQMAPTTLRAGAMIRGAVYDAAGNVVRGAQVQLTSEDQPGRNRQTRSDAKGRYEVRNVAEGRYKVSAMRTPAQGSGNPFHGIIDMKNSEVQVVLTENGDFSQDLYLGE